jgi:hypothetical protein
VSDANALKLVEAGALVGALVLFVWWQMRDLKKAAAETARKSQHAKLKPEPEPEPESDIAPAPRKANP